jgi:hypothetical protein
MLEMPNVNSNVGIIVIFVMFNIQAMFVQNWRYFHVFVWLQTEFRLVIGFTEHLYTKLVTTSNYNSLIGLHTLQITVLQLI